MRWLLVLVWLLCPAMVLAQSSTVLPHELELVVEVEETAHTPFTREMVLITIRGIYRRHITREQLVQPDFDGFSWTQLGDDTWRDARIDGKLVRTFERHMAIFADRPGTLTIGAFTHKLTLTDESDDWFGHDITSAPVNVEIAPAPAVDDAWFPVAGLRIADNWSNAPDQLAAGEGVLRIVRVEALGVTPEMIPPMPELRSPSAMIFPHPEKRFVELSPKGPVAHAYWRWTIRPSNDRSTIVEPLRFAYFDTVGRVAREVTISAQRVAYGTVVPEGNPVADLVAPARLPGWPMALAGAVLTIGGVFAGLRGHRVVGFAGLRRVWLFDPLARGLWHAARAGQGAEMRRRAAAMLRRDGATETRSAVLHRLDLALFNPQGAEISLPDLARQFLRGA